MLELWEARPDTIEQWLGMVGIIWLLSVVAYDMITLWSWTRRQK
jgi:hypothetical protein